MKPASEAVTESIENQTAILAREEIERQIVEQRKLEEISQCERLVADYILARIERDIKDAVERGKFSCEYYGRWAGVQYKGSIQDINPQNVVTLVRDVIAPLGYGFRFFSKWDTNYEWMDWRSQVQGYECSW